MTLVFDTETTGKADFHAMADAPQQPHLVQIGAQLLGFDLTVRAEINFIVKPEGYTIPKEASDVHGITTEIAQEYGFPLREVLSSLIQIAQRATCRVAHNLDFDDLVVGAAFRRSHLLCVNPFGFTDNGFCTMRAMTPICELPGPYGLKWPKLTEAYRHCFGKDFEGAHDAMADVRACALELGRRAVLIELNPEYVKLIRERCNVTQGLPL